jgi:hypothetical protein
VRTKEHRSRERKELLTCRLQMGTGLSHGCAHFEERKDGDGRCVIFVFLRPHVGALFTLHNSTDYIFSSQNVRAQNRFSKHVHTTSIFSVGTARALQGAALPKEGNLGHKRCDGVCAAGRLAARPVGRSCPRRIKTFGDLICLMVDGFCGHTGSRRLAVRPSERAQRARKIFTPNVRSVRSRFSGCVRGRFQIFLVRSENILFGRVVGEVSCVVRDVPRKR